MLKKQIQNDRIEKNLKVLKLLSNNDPSINEEQKIGLWTNSIHI